MNTGLPTIRIKETDNEIIIMISISKINIEDVELEIKEDFLKIEISKTAKIKDGKLKGWSNSSFIGKVKLPNKVIPMIPKRSYNGRILEIKLKKV